MLGRSIKDPRNTRTGFGIRSIYGTGGDLRRARLGRRDDTWFRKPVRGFLLGLANAQ